MEVYLRNPWLTYGIGLHRIRESGLGTELMDDLDEKPFTIDEIRDFVAEFFIGKGGTFSIRNPNIDFDGFIQDVQSIVDKEKPVWNPVKNKLTPWLDIHKIKVVYAAQSKQRRARVGLSRMNSTDDAGRSRPRRANGNLHASMNGAFNSSMPTGLNRTTTDFPRRTSEPDNSKPKEPSVPKPTSLQEVIQQWSRQAPSYKKLKPLETLLVDVPNLFPPTNTFVETHEYYFKWKEFSEDAFSGESGDELKELLRRASRKSKLFLHPDKLPNDLTENQDVLFKAIWDVIQESEAATFQ